MTPETILMADRKHVGSGEQQDPLQERFVSNQQQMFDMACAEIRKGMKLSCWHWFVLPTAPCFRIGVEQGSSMNRHHALRGDDLVKAHLEFETDGNDAELAVSVKCCFGLGVIKRMTGMKNQQEMNQTNTSRD
jgi:uncharacterized protein (DUF1810 family)